MGQHYSVQLADSYDGEDTVWGTRDSTLVAIGSLHAVADPRVFGYNVVGGEDLPDRHPAVREEAQLEGDVEVGFPAAVRRAMRAAADGVGRPVDRIPRIEYFIQCD